MLALIADAVAEVIFFCGSLFGHALVVLERDANYGAPSAWAVDPEMGEDEATIVVASAALAHFFHALRDLKVTESITNEGSAWSYSLSANLVLEQIKALRDARRGALARLERAVFVPTVFVNTLEARDRAVAWAVEPFLLAR